MPRHLPYDLDGFGPPAPALTVNVYFNRNNVSEIALIDTGSDITTLTNRVVRALGLDPIGEIRVTGATGPSELKPLYCANLDFRGKTYPNHALTLLNASYILIGRDILNEWIITLDGPKLTFRLDLPGRRKRHR